MHFLYHLVVISFLFIGCGGGSSDNEIDKNHKKVEKVIDKIDDKNSLKLILLGSNPVVIGKGNGYVEDGLFAFDDTDGDISSVVSISSTIDTNVEGEYFVQYTVQNSKGSKKTETRKVIVTSKTNIKNLNFTESKDILNGECQGELISALDNTIEAVELAGSGIMNGDWDIDNLYFSVAISGNIKVTLTAQQEVSIKLGMDCNTENIFRSDDNISHSQLFHVNSNENIYLSIFDWESNDSPYTLNIEFIPDNILVSNINSKDIAPKIVLLGDNPKQIVVGEVYVDDGVRAVDYLGQDISQNVKKISFLDENKVAEYMTFYTVSDSNGNITTIQRKVIVTNKTKIPTKPSITPLRSPYVSPNNQNIAADIFDSSFENENSADLLDSGASFDSDIKRSGNRSIKLDNKENEINIYNIPVEEGAWYIVSGYKYVNSLPSDVMRLYVGYTNEDTGHIFSMSYPVISSATANTWEEFIVPVYIQKNKNITDIKITVRNVGEPNTEIDPVGDVWIDDLGVYKVKDSSELFGFTKPVEKNSFDGTKTKVDSLGNIEFKIGDQFQKYFPLIVYPSGDIAEWSRYKQNGFNTIICNNPDEAQFAVNLGLNWIWDLHGYGVNDKTADGYDRFVTEYESMKENFPGLLDSLLYFYWDNEDYLVYDSLKIFSDKIKIMDVDENGNRKRPIYMHLDFTSGNKNYYNDKYKLVDMQGSYANPLFYKENDVFNYGYEFKGYYNAEFANFSMFENIPNSRIPKSIFVVNSPQDVHLENTIFAALARGGRGFGYWKDGGSQPDIQTRPWWNSFPTTVAKIDQLKPLLRTPHWTNWELDCSLKDDEDGLVVGKRDFDSMRCIIFSSRSDKNEIVRFTTPDKNIGNVYNFFDSSIVANGNGKSVTLNLNAKQSGVYCWD